MKYHNSHICILGKAHAKQATNILSPSVKMKRRWKKKSTRLCSLKNSILFTIHLQQRTGKLKLCAVLRFVCTKQIWTLLILAMRLGNQPV